MRVISIFVGGRAYRDRMRLLYALDPYVEEHVILTREETENPKLTHTRIIRPWLPVFGYLFWLWAGLVALWIILRGGCKERWLINEHFLCFGSLLPRFLLGRRVIVAVSLYAPNRSLFLEKAWDADPFARPISNFQRSLYRRRYGGNMRLDQFAARMADALVVNSEMIRQDILRIYPSKCVAVMPTSVTLAEHATRWTDSSHSALKEAVTFLYVGTMQPRKGIALLLEAFAKHSAGRTQDRLILVGGVHDVDRPWLERLLSRYNLGCQVEYVPHLSPDELVRKYRECDTFVFPSFYEGSPRVVKEAMVHGCPVIASDIPGTRLIDAQGRAIQYFPPGDVEALAGLMGRLARDSARRGELEFLSRKIVSESSHDRVAEKLAITFRQFLNGKLGKECTG